MIGELDPQAPVVLHCKGGGRSSIATSLLQSQGFANVSNLLGGYEAWVAAGFVTESGKPKPSKRTRNTKR
jgi:rhodanese-related sulfurtransferase